MSAKTKAEATEAKPVEAPKAEATEAKPVEAPKAEAAEAKPVEASKAEAAEAKPAEASKAEATEAKPAEASKAEATEAKPAEVEALQIQVAELKNQLQSAMDRLEAQEREARQAQRLKKAGIPESLGSFIREDADLESLSDALAALSKPAVAPVSTLPTVGTGNPGGKVMSVDEMLAAAEANGDREALSRLKLAKLASL